MRWRLMIAVYLGCLVGLCYAVSAVGGEPCAEKDKPILETHNAAKLHSILGRLSLDTTCYNKCSGSAPLHDIDGIEAFEVTARSGLPSLHYRLACRSHEAAVHISDAAQVRIESTVRSIDETEFWSVDQPDYGPLVVVMRRSSPSGALLSEESAQYPSFLHLEAAQGAGFRRHLLPLLDRLLVNGWIRCSAADLLAVLENQSEYGLPHRDQVRHLVEQLRSSQRHRRVEAEKQLQALGLPALSVIRSLPQTDLDMEQRTRLQQICRSLTPLKADTPAQIARWLVADVPFWNLLVNELTPPERERAEAILAKGTGISPNFPVLVAEAVR